MSMRQKHPPPSYSIPVAQVRGGGLDYFLLDARNHLLLFIRGLAVACWTTGHYHPRSNLGMGKSEARFIFDFVSLLLDVAQSI